MTTAPPAAQYEYNFTLEDGDAVLASNNGVHKVVVKKDRFSFMIWGVQSGELHITSPENKIVKFDRVGLPSAAMRVPDDMLLITSKMHAILLKTADVKSVQTFASHDPEAQAFYQKSPLLVDFVPVDLSKGSIVITFENGAYISCETISDKAECNLTDVLSAVVTKNMLRKTAMDTKN